MERLAAVLSVPAASLNVSAAIGTTGRGGVSVPLNVPVNVPLPSKANSEPPLTVTSSAVKSIEASDRVKVMPAVSPVIGESIG